MTVTEPPNGTEVDFPAAFLWGSSTAAHQVEGNNVNSDWWAWEQSSPHAAESSGDGIDHYHRYDSDFALLAALGQNAHRLSLEWSRIEPAPGQYSRAALEHYRRVLASAQAHGLTVFATLQHFTLPNWLAQAGGWLAPDAIARFTEFCHQVVDYLQDLMPYVCTINEPSVAAQYGHKLGLFPPGIQDPAKAAAVTQIQIQAHSSAVEAIAQARADTQSGICLSLAELEPVRPEDPDCLALCASVNAELFQAYLTDLTGDFLGVQYYTRWLIDPTVPGGRDDPPLGVPTTQMGWEIHPSGLGTVLRQAAGTGLPLYITENGIATADDTQRVAFLQEHLRQVNQCLTDGMDIRGYFHWSAFDNFEWNDGYRPTFGLIGIDRQNDLRRIVRPSAVAYGNIARTGRLDGTI